MWHIVSQCASKFDYRYGSLIEGNKKRSLSYISQWFCSQHQKLIVRNLLCERRSIKLKLRTILFKKSIHFWKNKKSGSKKSWTRRSLILTDSYTHLSSPFSMWSRTFYPLVWTEVSRVKEDCIPWHACAQIFSTASIIMPEILDRKRHVVNVNVDYCCSRCCSGLPLEIRKIGRTQIKKIKNLDRNQDILTFYGRLPEDNKQKVIFLYIFCYLVIGINFSRPTF
jgi:hypothetical protein